jgi:hypothetical protein
LTLPGSTKSYTQAQINDGFNPPDCYPQDHSMPEIVAPGEFPSPEIKRRFRQLLSPTERPHAKSTSCEPPHCLAPPLLLRRISRNIELA